MKNTLYILAALFAVVGMWLCDNCTTTNRVLAETTASAPGTIQGDLVIDFLGGIRGYVEPCG